MVRFIGIMAFALVLTCIGMGAIETTRNNVAAHITAIDEV